MKLRRKYQSFEKIKSQSFLNIITLKILKLKIMLKIFFLLFFFYFSNCKLLNHHYSPDKLNENIYEPFKFEKLNEFFNYFKEVFDCHLFENFRRLIFYSIGTYKWRN